MWAHYWSFKQVNFTIELKTPTAKSFQTNIIIKRVINNDNIMYSHSLLVKNTHFVLKVF